MNKSAIQKYAIWARREMIAQVEQRAYQYGITADGYGEENAMVVQGRAMSNQEQEQRWELIQQIKNKGFTQVMEEVAYTWFNRFIALRFMEINNYLPSHIRVFSDSTGAYKPEILSTAMQVELEGLDRNKVAQMIDANQIEDLYRYLLLTQCNALNEALPRMFEKMGGYTELLLPNNILRADGILGRMVSEIPEEDWTDQVQIIGWLYQYYNSELKDDTFALLKKNVKITKERIPSATQLFTPDWIVRYMVENSLGRLWIEGHPNDALKSGWKYYLDEAEQEADVEAQLEKIRTEYAGLKPQDIKVIDPCMGSGHILVYTFDVLVQIYKSYGISERDAAKLILENNLYGLDIDDRAAQLAYFAVMMKARQYDRRIFSRGVEPHIYAIRESNHINRRHLKLFGWQMSDLERNLAMNQLNAVLDEFKDAKEYGSILNVSKQDWELLYRFILSVDYSGQMTLEAMGLEDTKDQLFETVQIAAVMAQKYDVVITNPPYMGMAGMSTYLSDFVRKNYPESKSDLFAVFIEKCGHLTKLNRYYSLITMQSWMFLSSYEELRKQFLRRNAIQSLLHLGIKAFEEIGNDIVQTASFVARKSNTDTYSGLYFRLLTHNREEKVSDFLARKNMHVFNQALFADIPGSPIAYWVGPNTLSAFINMKKLGDVSEPKQGIATADNNRFLRLWHEVALNDIAFGIGDGESAIKCGKTWFPYQKGGDFRKWYGNNSYVVLWKNNGQTIKNFKAAVVRNPEYHLREGLSWTWITTGYFGARFSPQGSVFDVAGSTLFTNNNLYEILGYMCSSVADYLVKIINPTINFSNGVISKLPITLDLPSRIEECARENVDLSRSDWDSFETSWDFTEHPLVRLSKDLWDTTAVSASLYHYYGSQPNVSAPVELCFMLWQGECSERFNQMKNNEEELNQIFIDIYGLQNEVSPKVEVKDVTVHTADLGRDIRSLISYAVGCMFGRYSLDKPGLVYAGGRWNADMYKTYFPADENIIPICDDEYFDDDIVARFIKWIEIVYGKETLEDNLKFIAKALGGKGTPREVIRNYFLNDFYADHCSTYAVTGSGKRPIYWLFDSGKKNGFKALIYMHRYQSDLLARMRTDYVHEMQERYRTQLTHLNDAIAHASPSERVKLNKQLKKIQDQALELQKYEEKIHHLADRNISIDLDDGVKHNYALFGDVLAKIK